MIIMGRDHKLYYEAYNDASDLNNDGVLDTKYKGYELKFPAPDRRKPIQDRLLRLFRFVQVLRLHAPASGIPWPSSAPARPARIRSGAATTSIT